MSRSEPTEILIEEKANLDELPPPREDNRDLAEHEVTIGDLHGNALKLLHFLIREGVLEFISEAKKNYTEFVNIYKGSHKLTDKNYARVQALINQLKANKVKLVRLIGDELYDRGQNDILTLLLFDKLKKLDVPFEIMLSNHSLDYLLLLEGKDSAKKCSVGSKQSKSAIAAERFLMQNNSDTDEQRRTKITNCRTIIRINTSVYKPSLKLISYTSQFGDPPQINFFTHAPIGLKTIKSLATLFKTDFCDDTALHLIESVDRINAKFQIALKENKLLNFYNKQPRSHANYKRGYIGPEFPLCAITWNRKHSKRHDQYHSRHPKKYAINWVHGHLGVTAARVKYITPGGASSTNLDKSALGKAPHAHKTTNEKTQYLALKERKCSFNFELDRVIRDIRALHKQNETPLSISAIKVCKVAENEASMFSRDDYKEATLTLEIIKKTLTSTGNLNLNLNLKPICKTATKFQTKNNHQKKRFAASLGIFAGTMLLTIGMALTLTGTGAIAGIPMKIAAIKIMGACAAKYSAASISHGALVNSSGSVVASSKTLELAGGCYLASSAAIGGTALFFKKRYALTKKAKRNNSFSSTLFDFHKKTNETPPAQPEELNIARNGQNN